MIMLDTSACIHAMRGQHLPADATSDEYVISTLVEAELWTGVQRAGKKEADRVERLLGTLAILEFDRLAAIQTGKIIAGLLNRGTPIRSVDPFIAGHAVALGLPLLSANVADFEKMTELSLISWIVR